MADLFSLESTVDVGAGAAAPARQLGHGQRAWGRNA